MNFVITFELGCLNVNNVKDINKIYDNLYLDNFKFNIKGLRNIDINDVLEILNTISDRVSIINESGFITLFEDLIDERL